MKTALRFLLLAFLDGLASGQTIMPLASVAVSDVNTATNGLIITATTGTLTIANGKTFTVSNTLTLAGTDGTTMTFPATSATLARTDAANTFTGIQTVNAVVTGTQLPLKLVSSGSNQIEYYVENGNGNCFFGLTGGGNAIMSSAGVSSALIQTNGSSGIVVGGAQAVQMPHYGAGAATFDSSGNITSVSDARKKNIIGTFDRGLPEIRRLQPKLFRWRADSGLNPDDLNAGFIAQDVLPIIPEAIGKDKDGFYTFADRPVTAALVNAVKELDARSRQSSDWVARALAAAAIVLAVRANLKKK